MLKRRPISHPPDSERTVHLRVPVELLNQSSRGVPADLPMMFDPQSLDDDRTMMFVPPPELLQRSGLSGAERAPEPITVRPPAPPQDAQQSLAAVASEPMPEPLTSPADPSPAGAEEPQSELEVTASSLRRRQRSGHWRGPAMLLTVVLLLAAGTFAYMHSGRSLLMPSAPTKNG